MPVVVQTRAVAEPEATAHGLDELYVRHAPAAFRTAYFLTGDRDLAEDLVQDAFVRVAGRFRHLRAPEAFDAYLRRTIVNLFTSHLRRLRLERAELKRRAAEARPRIEDPDPRIHDDLWSNVRTLPERQRAAIVLRFYEDLSERETAEILGCSTGAVNSLVAHAMVTLRERMEGER
jgi:RNA polymerase sigma-70 factor (sigma-E family)